MQVLYFLGRLLQSCFQEIAVLESVFGMLCLELGDWVSNMLNLVQ